MKFVKLAASLVFVGVGTMGSWSAAQGQCRGGGQSAASGTPATTTAYTQTPLNNAYSQNPLGSIGYNQQAFAPMLALEQASRNQRMLTAMQVQSQSLALQNQVKQAQSLAKQMNKAGVEKRKALQQERYENLALRQERESAKRSKNYDSERSPTRLASVQ